MRTLRGLLAQFLLLAPRLIGAEALAEATSGVTPFPHQRQVVERLAGEYPRSWLVADEVGLGKTISAGLSLRRLLLSGEVTRALILPPANVCRQWQDELFEKFAIWAHRFDGQRFHGAHPDDVEPVPLGVNPYDARDILIVSSHLARRSQHQRLLLGAKPFDLIVVDEAHHARRQGFQDLTRYRPSRLMHLLDQLAERDLLPTAWLLTATPMQVHPMELRDLLWYVGLTGALEEWSAFQRFFAELAKEEPEPTDWTFLSQMIAGTPSPSAGPAEEAFLARVETRLGTIQRARLEHFGRSSEDAKIIANDLGANGRRELRAWLRQRSPVGQLITRHTRETLKWYRAQGLLTEPVADRDVDTQSIVFTPAEQELYEDLDHLLDRLMEAHGTRRGAGFVLTIYRRRLTSSWHAIHRTLMRRLRREGLLLELDLLDEDEAEDVDTGEASTVDDAEAVPLTQNDMDQLRSYVDRIEVVQDSKFEQLMRDLNDARNSARATIVFTQFTDTLDALRDRLAAAYRSQLATYTGAGGHVFRDESWVEVSKQELVEAMNASRVTVLLATDAASEGLNLQACSYLINYDLPWNPMKVEQRIGRIDRIGQKRPVITVRNYVVPDTVEEHVYAALAQRIDLFRGLLGTLQPILGATEAAFRTIFRAPRSERRAIEAHTIDALLGRVEELRRSGLDFNTDDSLPIPEALPSPVTLPQLQEALVELDVTLDQPGRPVTMEPSRTSRDPENWAALATYGHPRLAPALAKLTAVVPRSPLSVVVDGDRGPVAIFRADRSPAAAISSVSDLDDLGAAAAVGEAEERARHAVEQAISERSERRRDVLRRQRTHWYPSLCLRPHSSYALLGSESRVS